MKIRRYTLIGRAVLCSCVLVSAFVWAGPPETVNIHGVLVDSAGLPLPGERAWIVSFFDSAAGGAQIGADQYGVVSVSPEGLFNIAVTLPEGAFVVANLWYELAVDSDTPTDDDASDDVFPDRFEVFSVPFARESASVVHVDVADIGTGIVNDSEFNALDGLGGNIQAQLDSKPATNSVYTKSQTNTLLDAKANATNVYSKAEIDESQSAQDALIAAKADAADVNAANSAQDVEIAQKASATDMQTANATQDAVISTKANASDVYSKTEVDTVLQGKASNEDLATKANVDDVYTKSAANTLLNAKADASNVATQLAGISSVLDTKANSAELAVEQATQDAAISTKADAAAVYTKDEIDVQMAEKVDVTAFDESQAAQNTTISSKADSSTVNTLSSAVTTLGGQYLSMQVSLAGKANTSSVYTKTQADSLLAAKADKTYVDSQNAAQDTAINAKADAASVANSLAGISDEMATKANTADLAASQALQDSTITAQGTALEGKLPFETSSSIIVKVTDDALENGVNLLNAYDLAKTLKPQSQNLSSTNRATVILPPARYDLGTETLWMTTAYVDLVGLSTARENQRISSATSGPNFPVLYLGANDVHIENLLVECTFDARNLLFDESDPAAFHPLDNLSATLVRNCEFVGVENKSLPMQAGKTLAGRYENCKSGPYSFGFNGGCVNATFTDCIGGKYSFGSANIPNAITIGNSTFTRCTGSLASFGRGYVDVIESTFRDCVAGDYSFATSENASVYTSTFERCSAGNYSFGSDVVISSATFSYCVATGASAFNPTTGTPTILYCVRAGAMYPAP